MSTWIPERHHFLGSPFCGYSRAMRPQSVAPSWPRRRVCSVGERRAIMSANMPQTPRQSTVARPRAIGWWLAYAAAVLAIGTNTVFGLLSLLAPASFLALVGERSAEVSADAQIFAAYAGARELAIAGALLVLLFMRARRVLA